MKGPITILLLCGLLLPGLAGADRPGDERALAGIETGRILWDVTLGDPQQLASRLDVIRETYDDLVRQGVEPDMVFAFRGGAAGLITGSTDHLALGEVTAVERVHERLRALQQLDGVHMEACNIATRRFELGQDDLLPGIHLVGNTFLSMMGYGNQGYTAIRID